MSKNMIFISGMPRSGTTLLNYILHEHSEVSITPETHFFDKFYIHHQNIHLKSPNEIKKTLEEYLNNEYIDILDFTQNEKVQIIEAQDFNKFSLKTFFQSILKQYAKQKNPKYIGEKTPIHLEYIPIINNWYPNSLFIIITRDPRDVSNSLKKVPWNNSSPKDHALRWNKYIQLTNEYQHVSSLKDKIYEIKYEQLISQPEKSIKQLCDFIGIQFEKNILNYYKKATQHKELAITPWKYKNKEAIDKKNTNKWLKDMPLEEIQIIENITKEHLLLKGYQLSNELI